MIERFNFYDIYGNFIPGIVMLLLLWFPFGIVTNHWPDAQITSVAAIIVSAYLLGHLLQSLAGVVLPSKLMLDSRGKPGYPSILLMNPSEKTLAESLKRRISERVERRFSLYLHIEKELDSEKKEDRIIAADRNAAFFLCRPIVNKMTAYAEQFQGLYTLMRGVFISLTLGCFYDLGWVFGFFHFPTLVPVMQMLIGLLAIFILMIELDQYRLVPSMKTADSDVVSPITFASIVFLAFGVGYMLAQRMSAGDDQRLILFVVAGLSLFIALRFHRSYHTFAKEFAKAVWTYFAVLDETQTNLEEEH